jgi:hypothetical protein
MRRHLQLGGQLGAEALLELTLRVGNELPAEVVVLPGKRDDLGLDVPPRQRRCRAPCIRYASLLGV